MFIDERQPFSSFKISHFVISVINSGDGLWKESPVSADLKPIVHVRFVTGCIKLHPVQERYMTAFST